MIGKPLRAVSLFSGCGGLDLGVERAGFRVVLATDADARCSESYARNSPGVPFLQKPIEKLSRADLDDVLAGGPVDLLVGGPPCPPFSKSRFYRLDKPRALDDPTALATFTGYLKVLKYLRPRAFLLENVPGLAYKVHRTALEFVLNSARALGYESTWQVLNAADYGVPQIRERCIVLGSLEGPPSLPTPTHSRDANASLLDIGLAPWRTAGEVLAELDTEDNASDVGHFAGGAVHDLLVEIPPGDNYLYFTEKRGHPNPRFRWRSRYWSYLLKLSPDLPAWTIQARRSNNMGPFHWRNRILRIAEVKRLQTFPDEWFLSGTVEQQWRQVGNAVPPRFAEAVGNSLARHLVGSAVRARAVAR